MNCRSVSRRIATLQFDIVVIKYMNKLSKEEIFPLFSKKEQKTLKYPDMENIDWEHLDFLGWIHPSGHIGYIVYEFEGMLRALTLNINKMNTNKVGMCSICKTIHNSSEIALFSTTNKIDKNVVIGEYICSDLQCSLHIRGKIFNPVVQMWENLTKEDKIFRLICGIDKFFQRILYNHNTYTTRFELLMK